MTPSIDTMLNDLYKIDPTLRSREAELRRVVETFLSHTPHAVPDRAFVERLRRELVPQSSSSSLFHSVMLQLQTFRRPAVMAGGVATLAVLLTVGTLTYQHQSRSPFTTAGIETRSARAFGDLRALSFAGAPATNQAAEGLGGGAATLSSNPVGEKRIAMDSLIYIPISYTYTYAGDPLTLPSGDLPVYRRIPANGGALSPRTLGEISRGLIDLSTFGNKMVETVTLHDNEYSISLDYNSGRASIYPYWPTWGQDVPQPVTTLPSDESLIETANAFLAKHKINAGDYGAPQVDHRWRQYQTLAEGQSVAAPSAISVVYPFRFGETIVHDASGVPDGLRVNIDLSKNKVEGAWNITMGSFESSEYALETDADRILKFAAQGSTMRPWVGEGAEQKTLQLGTPTVTYIYSPMGNDAQNREIYVPALQFPVLDRPEPSGTYVPEAVIIPLVKDVLDQAEQQNNNPDKPMIMMKAQ